MSPEEKAYLEQDPKMVEIKRHINWLFLIVWMVIAIIGVIFGVYLVIGVGYVLGEYVWPFLGKNPRFESFLWIFILFLVVWAMYRVVKSEMLGE